MVSIRWYLGSHLLKGTWGVLEQGLPKDSLKLPDALPPASSAVRRHPSIGPAYMGIYTVPLWGMIGILERECVYSMYIYIYTYVYIHIGFLSGSINLCAQENVCRCRGLQLELRGQQRYALLMIAVLAEHVADSIKWMACSLVS